MILTRIPLAPCLLLAMLVPAAAGPAADAVKFFYDNVGAETAPEHRARFTGKARAYLDANDKAWAEREEVCLDFGLPVDAQDFDDAEIARTLKLSEAGDGGKKVVTARFTLFGEPRQIEWTMVEEAGAWKVADIASPGNDWRMSEFTCD